MTDIEIEQLTALLQKLRTEELIPPRMPLAVWQTLRGLVVQAAVEIVITQSGKDFLLTWREDEHWRGWHLPGGFLCPGESLEDACRRIAARELQVSVQFERLITVFVWPDHPYASVVSIVCFCSAEDTPRAGSFHDSIPSDIVAHHHDFLRSFLDSA